MGGGVIGACRLLAIIRSKDFDLGPSRVCRERGLDKEAGLRRGPKGNNSSLLPVNCSGAVAGESGLFSRAFPDGRAAGKLPGRSLEFFVRRFPAEEIPGSFAWLPASLFEVAGPTWLAPSDTGRLHRIKESPVRDAALPPTRCSRGSAIQGLGEISADRDMEANNRGGGGSVRALVLGRPG